MAYLKIGRLRKGRRNAWYTRFAHAHTVTLQRGLGYLVTSEAERDRYAIEKRSSERLCAPLYRWLVQAVVEFVGFVEN